MISEDLLDHKNQGLQLLAGKVWKTSLHALELVTRILRSRSIVSPEAK